MVSSSCLQGASKLECSLYVGVPIPIAIIIVSTISNGSTNHLNESVYNRRGFVRGIVEHLGEKGARASSLVIHQSLALVSNLEQEHLVLGFFYLRMEVAIVSREYIRNFDNLQVFF